MMRFKRSTMITTSIAVISAAIAFGSYLKLDKADERSTQALANYTQVHRDTEAAIDSAHISKDVCLLKGAVTKKECEAREAAAIDKANGDVNVAGEDLNAANAHNREWLWYFILSGFTAILASFSTLSNVLRDFSRTADSAVVRKQKGEQS